MTRVFFIDLNYLIMIAHINLPERFIPLLTVRDTNRALINQSMSSILLNNDQL